MGGGHGTSNAAAVVLVAGARVRLRLFFVGVAKRGAAGSRTARFVAPGCTPRTQTHLEQVNSHLRQKGPCSYLQHGQAAPGQHLLCTVRISPHGTGALPIHPFKLAAVLPPTPIRPHRPNNCATALMR